MPAEIVTAWHYCVFKTNSRVFIFEI